MSYAASRRPWIIRLIFIGMALIIIVRLLALQVWSDEYKILGDNITIMRQIKYPPRGVIYDCKGHVMCYNDPIYDLMLTAGDVHRADIDSAKLCNLLGIPLASYAATYERARAMNGPKRPGIFVALMTPEQNARFQENANAFPGFQPVERSIRSYPKASAGAILGYTGEVNAGMLKKDRFASYQQGDYVGLDGLELKYEEQLRGQRGIYYYERDKNNRQGDSYKKGTLDTPAIAGRRLDLYTDAELQEYGEKLMANKLGSIVAIDPSTGGILALISSPSYDPNLLRGTDRSKNFTKLYKDPATPLFNRAMKNTYPPGSTQKPMTALIALNEGAITPAYGYPCPGAYYGCGRRIACTEHVPGHAANLRLALANSCNSYFCNVYRMTVDMPKWGSVKVGLHNWYEHMLSFGFGHPVGIDLPYETSGTVFDTADYNKLYHGGGWNSCTNVYIGMGQGELTVTPVQMANGMCMIANKGWYYTPHLVRAIGGNPKDSALAPYLEKHVVSKVAPEYFDIVQDGMQDVVERGTARIAKIDGINICAKTGTAENNTAIGGKLIKLQNNSMFVAFAPREHPRIAIAVAVENAGYGATWAGPIASLMIEKYLRDTISAKRKPMEQKMLTGKVINPYLAVMDSIKRARAVEIYSHRIDQKRIADSTLRAYTATATRRYVEQLIEQSNQRHH